ncbi:RagB/SusD family nutrient uptake outer membrane protein [Pedobacter sp. MC2016-14]|uniref:RagB/SusD family nutrient uptake outer membrane protein n=1 Tax=Pedobacter sp. MC2016-14 TaxID=2897327 RepID=UPI001E286563|nr:RagB/SusD family nutrient uptake outer membrane protein [Pedobacter sp. MC2016-14]MCD0487459.1 RagB/SusD family nutrient uptake outer membrane protein [Pedobacter sp. MC2016-14]
MKKYIKKTYSYKMLAILILMAVVSSCKKEYADPNAALADDVFGSSRGLTGVAVGLQKLYSAGRPGVYFSSVTANGFVTNELFLTNAGNVPELQLSTGGNSVDGTNAILANLWANSNKIIFDADNVMANAPALADKGYASGLIAYVSIFKALAIGNMSQYWERVPSGIGTNVSFITRVQGFTRAIAVIDNALSVVAATPISANFLTNVPAGVDIQNTLYALKARYALFAGNYTLALTAANSVDLTKRSSFNFDNLTFNPIFDIATSTGNVFQPMNANLGLTGIYVPDPADKRVPFYTVANAVAPLARLNGFFTSTTTAIPIYLPGEIILIKAEAYARQSTPDLGNALTQLNLVVTKQPAADPFGVGAGLPAIVGPISQSDLLNLIYKHRSIELYMSGLKLEDMRRFGLPNADRKRNFFPYPFTERDNNPNTPADPAF